MSFLLVPAPENWPDGDEALMEMLGAVIGLRKLRRISRICHTLGHPVTEFIGRLDGHEVRIGGDLLLNIPVAYAAHLCVTGHPSSARERINSALFSKLQVAGFNPVKWPAS